MNATEVVNSLQAAPPAKPPTGLISGDILVTGSDSRVLEIAPDGTQVQTFALPAAITNNPAGAAFSFTSETAVDGRGELALRYDTETTSTLYLVNPQSEQATPLTAPDWSPRIINGGSLDEVVPDGLYLFATYGHLNSGPGQEELLRFDPATGVGQGFGQSTLGFLNTYSSLAAGPDGSLYAMNSQYAGLTVVDVYDPNTLKLLRSVTLNPVQPVYKVSKTANAIAVGPAGEFYALSNDRSDATLYKLSPQGQTTATLPLPDNDNTNYLTSNLRVNARGAVLVGARDPILVDPPFQTVTVLNAFGDLESGGYAPSATATFVP